MKHKKTNAIRIIEKNAIEYEPLQYQYDDSHIDAISVAKSLNQDICYVYKTLVLQGNDKNYYVCILRGDDELDLKKVATAFHIKNISMIPVDTINKVTGYIRGGCSPIGMKKLYPTILDRDAKELPYIIVSAGQRGMQVKMKVSDLIHITNARFEDIKKKL